MAVGRRETPAMPVPEGKRVLVASLVVGTLDRLDARNLASVTLLGSPDGGTTWRTLGGCAWRGQAVVTLKPGASHNPTVTLPLTGLSSWLLKAEVDIPRNADITLSARLD